MKKRISLDRIPEAGNVWKITDVNGGNITLLSYSAPKEDGLIGESLTTRRYLSFDPKPTLWGESKLARVSEIFVDKNRKLHLGFRNKPGMPIFYFTTEVNCPAILLVSVKDDLGNEKRRFFIVFNSEEIKITKLCCDEQGNFTERKLVITLREKDPGYMRIKWSPKNSKAPG